MRGSVIGLLVVICACSADPGTSNVGGSGRTDGGEQPGIAWSIEELAPASHLLALDLAVASDGRVGVVWFAPLGTMSNGSVADYALRYRQWHQGVAGPIENVRVVQRIAGVSVAFGPDGQPAIAFLGGDNVTPLGTSAFWLQSDAAIMRRVDADQWVEEVVTKNGDEAIAGNPVSDRGFLVGLSPALGFSQTQTYLAWRDAHDGQFPQQDWNGSDLEVAVGSAGSWTRTVVMAGGDDKQAWGGHIDLVVANGQPAVVSDQAFGAADAPGQNLVFSRRQENGTWTPKVRPIETVGNTQSGASLAYDATLGFAIAVVDRTEDALYFTRSVNDGATWSAKSPVWQFGSGGWYPSLSVDPQTHAPSIAFYVCSKSAGAAEGSCSENDDELRITERLGQDWRDVLVDPSGGWHPKLGHLPSGKRVVAYRDPRSGSVKLAVER